MAEHKSRRIREAEALARDLHAEQKRKGTDIPYIEHPMGVAEMVREAGGTEDQIIAALLHGPKVLFLDEPTIGLDVVSQKRIREFVREYNKTQGTTIILTSHYMDDIQELCERVVIIDHGHVVFDDALATLVKQYSHTKRLKLTFSTDVERADTERYGTVLEFDGSSITLEVPRDQSAHVAAAVLEALPVADITIDEMGAEEVIRQLFQSREKGAETKAAA